MIFGLHLHSFHDVPGFVDETVGIYLSAAGSTVGVLRNSEGGTSAYLAWTAETNTLYVGRLQASAALSVGGIAGYRRCVVCPLVMPSIAVGLDDWRLRIGRLPKPGQGGSGAWHLSIEYQF